MIRREQFHEPRPFLSSRILRAVTLSACALGLLLVSAGQVGAADDVNSYVPSTGVQRLEHPSYYTDHSGVALTPTGALLVVDNGEDVILEYLPNGQGWTLGRTFEVGEKCEGEGDDRRCTSPISDPIYDLEDITWMGGDKYALIDEWDNALSVIRIPDQGTTVTEVYSLDLWPWVDHFAGNGIEGLAYSFDESVPGTDTFYVGSEANALLVRLDFDSATGAFKYRGPDIRLQIPTISAVHDVEGDDTFYVVSNRGRAVYRFDKSGMQLGPERVLGFVNPEGLTMSPDLGRMIVVGESFGGNELQEFTPGAPTNSQTVFAQVNTSADDAIESGGTVTTTGALLLGDSADVAGLRFTNICIPSTAKIASAHLAFFTTTSSFSTATLAVQGVRGPDAGSFRAGPGGDISERVATARRVESDVYAWVTPYRQYMPDLSAIISELVGQSDRGDCDAITLQLRGTGTRSVFSRDLSSTQAPSLVIDWSDGPTPLAFDVSVASSCLANRGRVDVTVSNPTAGSQTAVVSLSGLPARGLDVPGFGQATTTFTGRSNGRYLVEVTSNGATNTNELVVASCEPDISVESLCLAENGLLRIRVGNPQSTSSTFSVNVGNLSPRVVSVAPNSTGRIGVSGRADGDYDITVTRRVNGGQVAEPVYTDVASVACDAAPLDAEVSVSLSCLSRNGLISVTLYNTTDTTRDYTVRFGSLPERARTVPAGGRKNITISGRPDGQHQLTVMRGNAIVRQVTAFVSCDQLG